MIDFRHMKSSACQAIASITLLLASASLVSAQGRGREPQTGESMYKQSCAPCHDGGVERAPQREALKAMSPERVLDAMETGQMIYMAARWPVAGRRAIAVFVTGKNFGTALTTTSLTEAAVCPAGSGDFSNPWTEPRWNGWGPNTSNTR